MKYPYIVKVDNTYYPAGSEVPEPEKKTQELPKEPEKEVRRGRPKKTEDK